MSSVLERNTWLIHSLRQILAPGCLPIFTSDGLNLYFYALTAHFGQWLTVGRRGCNVCQWQVEPGLIYGQVKKCYRRRKLVRVRHVMRLGTQADLAVALQKMGFGGAVEHGFHRAGESDHPTWNSRDFLVAPGRRRSSLHPCSPIWSGGEPTITLSVLTNRCG